MNSKLHVYACVSSQISLIASIIALFWTIENRIKKRILFNKLSKYFHYVRFKKLADKQLV